MTSIQNDITNINGEKILIGCISAEKKATELQPTGMVMVIRHYNKSVK